MPTLNLDIVVLPTFNVYNMAVVDNSTYPTEPPVITSPTIQISVPNFGLVTLTDGFVPQETNVYNSTDLEITTAGNECALPDGIYTIKYSIFPHNSPYYVQKTIMRIDKLQEKYDNAFMQLDLMECDKAIKAQQMSNLMSVYFFIQGAVAAANNCATAKAGQLYSQADRMLDYLNNCDCGNFTNNFIINFQ